MVGVAQCQQEVEEVTELMRQNLGKALEREGRLQDLESRARDLHAMGTLFRRSTRVVARQERRGHWRLVAIGVVTAVLLLLALGLALGLLWPPPVTVTVTIPTPQLLPGMLSPQPVGSEVTGDRG
ncbi:vesicle-associated membrane protein 5-like [Heliangelus exortis]|uniref:vesicle-associated membrane protein 5-like n=1 Tax=Heliangelus exortis TaxID=472823 RepID=UPI003A915002